MCADFKPITKEYGRFLKHIPQTANLFKNKTCREDVRDYDVYMQKKCANCPWITFNCPWITFGDFEADGFDGAKTGFLFGAGIRGPLKTGPKPPKNQDNPHFQQAQSNPHGHPKCERHQ